jgi:hypothetical protein
MDEPFQLQLDTMIEENDSVSTESQNLFDELSESDMEELESNVQDMLHQYLEDHFIQWSDPNFMDIMVNDITEILYEDFIHAGICTNEYNKEEIEEYIREYATIVCELEDIVPRSESHIFHLLEEESKENIREKIKILMNKPQPQQRTNEWYEYRHGLITASNIWKALSSESQQNSLIYEKCQPFVNGNRFASCTTGSLHWGVKYEPLTLMLYKERMNIRSICDEEQRSICDEEQRSICDQEFGCIQHDTYKFIGASPDGIVIDESSPLYGRMIEIKNIVNREIDGIPLKAYWIQMQVQMETCNLDACDFVETQIKEYETEDAFWNETEKEKKGILLMFVPTESDVQVPLYNFMPLHIPLTKEDTQSWIDSAIICNQPTHKLHEIKYWYLDIFSCVTVRRNRRWFQTMVPMISKIWDTILRERENGHEHRAPKKRIKTSAIEKVIVNKLD